MSTPVRKSAPDAPSPPLLAALSGRRPARTPVWFMRQAGRSLPEYRALRQRVDLPMLEVCLRPELAAEATLQPVRRHGVDAAVFFSDIMVPLRLAGVDVRIEPGTGPVMAAPVRSRADVEALASRAYGQADDGAGVRAVAEGVRAVVAELGAPGHPGAGARGTAGAGAAGTAPTGPEGRRLSDRELAGLAESHGPEAESHGPEVGGRGPGGSDTTPAPDGPGGPGTGAGAGWTPVVGFGGAPFTLAAYLVEGRPSRDHLAARTLMHADPEAWHTLMTWCARLTGAFIATQVEAGAAAAQLFDSWAGSLSPADYRRSVAPYSALALDAARRAVSPTTGTTVPLIHFGTGTARILPDMLAAGADAVGVDERTDLGEAVAALAASRGGRPCPVQGNLDPALLGAPRRVLAEAVTACLEAGATAGGHVVNLGHGVPPGTDPAVLTGIVAQVHGCEHWADVAREPWEGPA